MRINRERIALLCAIGLFLAAGALWCVRIYGENQKMEPAGMDKKQRIAIITKSTTSAFWRSVRAGADNASTAYNTELIFEGPDNEENYQMQNELITQRIQEGVDALVVSAVDYNANVEPIETAAGQGIPVVVIDSDVNTNVVKCRIGTDNYNAGAMAGQALCDGPEETICVGIVNFDKNSENGQKREQGFRDAIREDARISVADTVYVLSTVEDAMEGTKELLKKHPEINAIVTFNEWTSLGVGYAIKEMELKDAVRVIAFDSNVVSVGMLETGEVDALIVQNPYAMGYLGVETAYNIINGRPIQSERINTETTLVTRKNMYDEECQRILFAFEKSNKNE